MLADFAGVAQAISATTKKSVKETLLAGYLIRLDDAELERAVVFLSGGPFPRRDERVIGIGWSTIATPYRMSCRSITTRFSALQDATAISEMAWPSCSRRKKAVR